jgi:uncharacterized membrane protein affecting hemolysin expression
MKTLRQLPLAQKLVLAMMATSSVALLVACSFFLGFDIIGFRQRLSEHLISVAEIIGANTAASLTYDDPRSATLVLHGLKAEPHILAANIYRADGEIFVTYRRDSSVKVLLPAHSPSAGGSVEPEYLTECRAIVLDKENVGSVCLQADEQEIRSRVQRYLAFVLGFMLTSIAAAFLWLWCSRGSSLVPFSISFARPRLFPRRGTTPCLPCSTPTMTLACW